MELIALAVLFALAFVPLFLATEIAAGHPDTARMSLRQPVHAPGAGEPYPASHPQGARLPAAANDENERLAA